MKLSIAIVNVEFVNVPQAVRVLNHCRKVFHIADSYLFAPTNPAKIDGCPTLMGAYIKIPYMTKECISYPVLSIGSFIDHDYVILVQNDGYIIHPENWRWEFLDYDFIGPLWPENYPGGQRVGCGGFSLRSRKLMGMCINHLNLFPYNIPPPHRGEDFWIASVMRPVFEGLGAKYAPVRLAGAWGIESAQPDIPWGDEKCFGFHKFNTPQREAYKEMVK